MFDTLFTLLVKPVTTTMLWTDEVSLDTAAKALVAWELVAFPTETVYGLGADAYNEEAVKTIFMVKQRPSDNPLIVHVANHDAIDTIATIENSIEETLITSFMPWPFSLVLSSKKNLAPSVSPHQETVCIRIPDHPTAQQLLTHVKTPIAAPSANRSGRPSPTTAAMVYDDLHDRIPYIIDGWASVYGIESTVVKVEWTVMYVLRPGFITAEDIAAVVWDTYSIVHSFSNDQAVHAPGTRYMHYAPHQPVFITHSILEDINHYLDTYADAHIALMVTEETHASLKTALSTMHDCVTPYLRWSRLHLSSCAASLYHLYHIIEKTHATAIFVEALPESWLGLSIMNRVKKSALIL